MNDNAKKFIQDLIRTNVLELVKTDEDINRLIDNGLLKSVDEVMGVTAQADKILRNNCDERCKIRVGPGHSEDNFKCRKLNPVCDSPDPTIHSYVQMQYKFQKKRWIFYKILIYIMKDLSVIFILIQRDIYLRVTIMQHVICHQ